MLVPGAQTTFVEAVHLAELLRSATATFSTLIGHASNHHAQPSRHVKLQDAATVFHRGNTGQKAVCLSVVFSLDMFMFSYPYPN